jgi:hypothetical protein
MRLGRYASAARGKPTIRARELTAAAGAAFPWQANDCRGASSFAN